MNYELQFTPGVLVGLQEPSHFREEDF
jgi:hypothetical protein